MKHTLSRNLAWAAMLTASAVSAQTARVNVIHNCADAAAEVVDIYIDADLGLDDVAFRTASGFIDLPAGVEFFVGIAPGTSTSANDIIASFPFTLAEGETYVLVASGIVSASGYTPNPAFDLVAYAGARESAMMAGQTDVLVFHGATDAPVVDVAEVSVPAGTVIDDMAYGEYRGYLELPSADYQLQVQLSDGTPVVTYDAPLSGFPDEALTVVASGFLDPSANSNGPTFGLWAARATGGALIELPVAQANETARVQVIHNSADAAAAVVDVYLNDDLAIDNFAFRTATDYLDLPAEEEIVIGIAPGNSTSVSDVIASFPFTLEAGGTYIVVANGIVSASGYDPVQPFNLDVFATAQEAALVGTNTDVLVYHGCTDAPTVDVAETSVPAGVVVDDISYSEFQGYLALATADYELEVRTTDGTPVARYDAPLATLGLDGAAITVLASGFLNTANNSDGPGFGLFVALSGAGPLVPLPLSVGLNELQDASLDVTAWPNPARDILNINIDARGTRNVTATISDMMGRTVLEIPSTVVNAGENRLQIGIETLSEGMYTLVLSSEQGIRTLPVQVAR